MKTFTVDQIDNTLTVLEAIQDEMKRTNTYCPIIPDAIQIVKDMMIPSLSPKKTNEWNKVQKEYYDDIDKLYDDMEH
jgi:hypothetical protein